MSGWLHQALPHGDYLLGSGLPINPIVERKTLANFLGDMRTGTLPRQMRALVAVTPFPILLIEGHWRMDDGTHLLDSGFTWEMAWNELATLQDMGCRIQLTTDLQHTLKRLPELVRYYAKDIHESAARQLAGDRRLQILTLIPGIGVEKAKNIVVKFPDYGIADLANLQVAELVTVKGIGEELAKRYWNWCHLVSQ
jgi:ERCC4-type nuclease